MRTRIILGILGILAAAGLAIGAASAAHADADTHFYGAPAAVNTHFYG